MGIIWIQRTHTQPNVTIHEMSPNGMIIEQQGKILFYEESWRIFSTISKHKYTRDEKFIDECINEVIRIQGIVGNADKIAPIMDELFKLQSTIHEINEVILNVEKPKTKRSPYSTGSAIPIWFGSDEIEDLKRNSNKYQQILSDHTIYLRTLTRNIEMQYNATENQIIRLLSEINKYIETQNKKNDEYQNNLNLAALFQLLTLTTVRYKGYQDKVRSLVLSNEATQLDPELVPLSTLTEVLSEIKRNSSSELIFPWQLINETQEQRQYTAILMKAYTHDSNLIFELIIPLISSTRMNLYAVTSAPTILNHELVFVDTQTPYIITDEDKTEIMYIGVEDLKKCYPIGNSNKICPNEFPMFFKKPHKNYCELAILNNINDHNNNCAVKTIPIQNMIIKLKTPNQFYYVTSKENKITIDCQNKIRTQFLNNTGIITLGKGCKIYNNNFKITAQTVNHMQQNISIQSNNLTTILNITHSEYKIILSNNNLKEVHIRHQEMKKQLDQEYTEQEIKRKQMSTESDGNNEISFDEFDIILITLTILFIYFIIKGFKKLIK